MKATVNIEFESFGDLTTALYETIRAVKKQAKGQLPDKKVMDRSLAEPVPFELDGDNCYGSFEILVSTDGTEGEESPEDRAIKELAVRESAPAPTGEGGDKAIAFAEWKDDNYVNYQMQDGKYYHKRDLLKHIDEATVFTTVELYDIFIQWYNLQK